MWRYLVGVNRGRNQWNGVIRSSPQSVCRDDVDTEVPKAKSKFLSKHSARTYHEGRRDEGRENFRRYCRTHCLHVHGGLPRFTEALIISSSLLLSCQLSKIWKCYHEDERRRHEFFLHETLNWPLQLRTNAVDSVFPKERKDEHLSPRDDALQIKATFSALFDSNKACQKEETETRILRQIRSSSLNDFLSKKVRFAEQVEHDENDYEETANPPTQPESHFEQFYTEFENNWKDLCEQYDKMKCNKKGVLALELNGDLECAISHFRSAGDAGCARAQFNLGLLHHTGRGFKRNLDMAVECYKMAADLGSAEAAHNLALIYLSSEDLTTAVTMRREIARDLLESAARGGVAQAKTELGVMCTEEGDYERAFALFTEAAQQQDTDAVYMLGVCHEAGLGTPHSDESAAAELYRRASRSGHAHAQCRLAHFYQYGLAGLPKDLNTAVELYEESARAGSEEALQRLNTLMLGTLEEDQGGGVSELRHSSSAPSFLTCLQHNLLTSGDPEWEYSSPTTSFLPKSDTYSGQLSKTKVNLIMDGKTKVNIGLSEESDEKFQRDKQEVRMTIQEVAGDTHKLEIKTGGFGLDITNFPDWGRTLRKPKHSVRKIDENKKVYFRIGEDPHDSNKDGDKDSLNWYEVENSSSGVVLDGGFGSFAPRDISKPKPSKKSKNSKKTQPEYLFLDGGFGFTPNGISRDTSGIDRNESKDSLLSFQSSSSDLSITFDENCAHPGLLSLA